MRRYEGWWQGMLLVTVGLLLSGRTPGLVSLAIGAGLGVWIVRRFGNKNPTP